MQQTNIVLRKTCPQVPGRNWQPETNSADTWILDKCNDLSKQASLHHVIFTLLCSIVLVGLTVPLPNIAIEVIKIVRGHIRNAVQLKEVRLRGQSPEHRQQPPRRHGWRGRSEPRRSKRHCTPRLGSPLIYVREQAACSQPGSVHHSPWQAKEERSVYGLVRRLEVTAPHKKKPRHHQTWGIVEADHLLFRAKTT